MTAHFLIPKSKRFPSPVGEGLGVRLNLTKRQIEVTMFTAGVERLEGLQVDLLASINMI